MSSANSSPLTLQPLSAAEETLLCGREAEVRAILENCEAGRLTVVLSRPGFGASSLLRAGVQPVLLRAGTIVAICSDWDGRTFAEGLRETVAAAVHGQTGIPFATKEREQLIELLDRARAKTGKPIAVFLDQFEEYLRCHAGTAIADDFDAELSHAVSSRAAQFVIAMHPSAVGEFGRFSQFIPNLLGYTVNLAPIGQEAAAELVRRRGVDPAVVNEIVSARMAAVEGGVNPSFITIAAQGRLDAGHRGATESPDRVILTSLDPILSGLRASERGLLLQWLPVLVTEDGHRIAVSLKVLTERASARGGAAESALASLIRAGLLRHVTTRFGVRYLLTRDFAAPILQDWGARMQRIRAARRQTFLRAVSVLVGVIALLAAYLVYYGGK
ncbi:MAG TPA: hypothetical protein VHC72_01760 [Bryobacteraceae bacterium]|nr:hypothetical protein [Bryobacteraceae bacterium]